MPDWLPLHRLVDLAMAILVIEAVILLATRKRHGLGLASIALIALAGVGLLVALRAALAGASPLLLVAGLTVGGVAHAADLARRLRRGE